MDEELYKDLNQKQKTVMNAKNLTEEEFAAKYTNISETMKQNQKAKRDIIDNKVFGGKFEEAQQKTNLDYTHDYVLEGIKSSVSHANQKVHDNIMLYGKAVPTQQDKSVFAKLKGLKDLAQASLQKVKSKSFDKAEAYMEMAKEKNEFADYSTGTMIKRLLAHTGFQSEYLKDAPRQNQQGQQARQNDLRRTNVHFEKVTAEQTLGVYGEPLTALKKELFTKYRFSVIPFLKTYKKGWFGRYYDLDGKRIKTKSGEKNPADYNKEILESLMLETDKEKLSKIVTNYNKDEENKRKRKTKKLDTELTKNRQKKAQALTMITKELLAEAEKFDVSKLTDKYVTEHIVELQSYRDRLFAFLGLYQENRWFFFGKDLTKQQIKTLQQSDAEDPEFVNLITTKILNMAAPVATFLESHMAAHGMKNNADIHGRKYGFRQTVTPQQKHKLALLGEDAAKNEESSLIKTAMRLADPSEASDRWAQFGNDFDVVDMTQMTEEEKISYRAMVNGERSFVDSKAHLSFLAESLDEINTKANRPLSKDVTKKIKKELEDIQKRHKKSIEDENEGKPDHKKVEYFPGAHLVGAEGASDGFVDIQTIKELMHSELGRDMYMTFGPELDHLYAKLYAAARMEGELAERKEAINKKFKFSTIRKNNADLKNNQLNKLVKKSRLEENQKIIADNKKVFTAKESKNPYAGFVQEMMAEKRLNRAEQEYDEIDKKLAFVKYEMNICFKAMRFFLRNPQENVGGPENFKEISRFLRKEGLGYMVDADRLESSDRILDEALGEVEGEWQSEQGIKNAKIDKINNRGRKQRNSRIYDLRRKGRANAQTEKGLREFKATAAGKGELQAFVELCEMDSAGFVNIKANPNFLSMEDEKDRKKTFDIIVHSGLYLNAKNNPNSFYNPRVYTNATRMQNLMNEMREKGYKLTKNTLIEFMADIRAKMDMIGKAQTYVNTQLKIQSEKKYFYVDTDRVDDLDTESLKKLIANLKLKESVLKNKADSNPLQTNNMGIPLADEDQPWLVRKTHRELENCRNLLDYAEKHLKRTESLVEYESFGAQAYEASYGRHLRELRLSHVKKTKYFAATDETLAYMDMMERPETQPLLNGINDGLHEKLRKDKKLLENEKFMTDELMKIMVELRNIEINRDMVDELKKNFGLGETPSMNVFQKYLKHLRVIKSALDIVGMPEEMRSKEGKKLTELLKKNNMYEEFSKKSDLLMPIYTILNGYAKSIGFLGAGYTIGQMGWSQDSLDEIEDDKEREKREEEIEAEAGSERIKCSDAVTELEKKFKAAEEEKKQKLLDEQKKQDEQMGRDYIAVIYDRLYNSGEKYSIHQTDKWKKELEKLAKDKGQKGEARWEMIAAQMLLKDWPYSFQVFAAIRAEKDTAKAITQTLQKFAGKFGSAYVDADSAGKIANVIAENETAGYKALNGDMTRQLDKALQVSGIDAHEFKKLFEKVEVNGAGLPLSYQDKEAREDNTRLANAFINRFKDGKEEKELEKDKYGATRYNALYNWNKEIIDRLKSVTRREITSEMVTPEYIKKNFKRLYEESRSYKILQQFYNKDFKDHPEILENHKVSKKQMIQIQNAFGVEKNNLFKTFYDTIEAYASTQFVDKEGRLDMGLTNEEIGSNMTQAEMRVKLGKVTDERNKKFDKLASNVKRALDQKAIADKIAKADEINQTLKTIKVGSTDNLFKMVQNANFEGKMDDVNLMLQNDELSDLVSEYNDHQKVIEEAELEIERLKKEYTKLENEKKNEEAEKVTLEIIKAQQKKLNSDSMLQMAEKKIKNFQVDNEKAYSYYQACHDEKGVFTHGTKDMPLTSQYIAYQVQMAPEMKKIYDGFVSMKNTDISKTMFTEDGIATRMKREDWPKIMRDLKRLDLYLYLFEQDTKHFKVKQKGFLGGEKNLVSECFRTAISSREKDIKGYEKEIPMFEKKLLELDKQAKKLGFSDKQLNEISKTIDEVEAKLKELKEANPANKEELTAQEKSLKVLTEIRTLEGKKKIQVRDKTGSEKTKEELQLAYDFVHVIKMDTRKEDKNTSDVEAVHKYVKMMYATMVKYGVNPDGSLMEDTVKNAAKDAADMFNNEKQDKIILDALNKDELNKIVAEQEQRGNEIINQIQGKKSMEEQAKEYNKEHKKEVEKELKEKQKEQEKKDKKDKKNKVKTEKEINIALDSFDNATVIDLGKSRDSVNKQ